MTHVFISYRRADSQTWADRIYPVLVKAFGKENVFKDIDSISAGQNFRAAIEKAIIQSDVVLILIGHQWVTITDNQGLKRLDNLDDPVRLEVELALRHVNIVIPVFVDGAEAPSSSDLPPSFNNIPLLNGANLRSDPDFDPDIVRLIHAIRERVREKGSFSTMSLDYYRYVSIGAGIIILLLLVLVILNRKILFIVNNPIPTFTQQVVEISTSLSTVSYSLSAGTENTVQPEVNSVSANNTNLLSEIATVPNSATEYSGMDSHVIQTPPSSQVGGASQNLSDQNDSLGNAGTERPVSTPSSSNSISLITYTPSKDVSSLLLTAIPSFYSTPMPSNESSLIDSIFDNSTFSLKDDDYQLLKNSMIKTSNTNSLDGTYSFSVNYDYPVDQKLVDISGGFILDKRSGSTKLQLDGTGEIPATENGHFMQGKLDSFQGELRLIGSDLYIYPVTRNDQLYWGHLDNGLGFSTSLAPNQLSNQLQLSQMLSLMSFPINSYTTIEQTGAELIEGMQVTKFHIRVMVLDMLKDPEFQQNLSQVIGIGDISNLFTVGFDTIKLDADIYVSKDDMYIHRLNTKLVIQFNPTVENPQNYKIEILLNLTLKDFNQNYDIKVPSNTIPLHGIY